MNEFWYEGIVDGYLQGFFFGTEQQSCRIEQLIGKEGHICEFYRMTNADIVRHNSTPGRMVISADLKHSGIKVVGGTETDKKLYWRSQIVIDIFDRHAE